MSKVRPVRTRNDTLVILVDVSAKKWAIKGAVLIMMILNSMS